MGYSLRVAKSRTRLSDFTSLISLTNLEFFFKWVGSVVISFSFCLFKDPPPCPLSWLLTSYVGLLTICPVLNSFSRTYPRTFVENRCILVSAGFSVVVTKSSHKAAFFILHVLGNLLFSNRVDFRLFVLGVQELDSVINRCTAVLLGDLFP